MNSNTSAAIVGQIHFTANHLGKHGGWEFNITATQAGKNLEHLVGMAPEYHGIAFSEARVKHNRQHGVEFNKLTTTIGLEDGKDYAALIRIFPGEQKPFILSVCTQEAFTKAKEKKVVEKPHQLPVPQGIFRVCILGNKLTGDLEKIMQHFTTEWAEDPTITLQSSDAKWEQKGPDSRYYDMACPPTLPPLNTLVLSMAEAKKGQASVA